MDIVREKKPNRRRPIMIGLGLAGVLLVTLALSRLEPRAPGVDRATLWIDSVSRGEMVREVKAPGALEPERMVIISAVTAGRVEALPLRPGVSVDANTVIATLTNPDVDLQLLEAQRQLGTAQANLITLRSSLAQQRLQRESATRALETEYNTAQRELQQYTALAEKKLASENEIALARDRADELSKRMAFEREQLKLLERSVDEQIEQAQAQVRQMQGIVAYHLERQASMNVRAGEAGELQELPLELGQWVTPGERLARIAQPGKLKAVLRVPETQAKDIAIGQNVKVDRVGSGSMKGRVMRIDPVVAGGTVEVEVELLGELPQGARADMNIDGTIEVDRLENVLYVARPGYGQPESMIGIFRLEPDGKHAERVQVQLGRASVSTVEIRSGLEVGDRIIISDMTQHDAVSRVRIQ